MKSWYHLVVNQMAEGVVLVQSEQTHNNASEEYRVLAVNPAFETLISFPKEKLINKCVANLFPNANLLLRNAIYQARLTGNSVFSYHSKLLRKYMEVNCRRHSSDSFVFIISDLTDKLDAECTAKIAEQTTENFMATIGHELRTPLNGLLGSLELLKDTELLREQLELVDWAEQSSRRLHKLVCDALDYTKAKNGISACYSTMAFNESIAEIIHYSKQALLGSEIVFSASIDNKIPTIVIGDCCIIYTLLSHLLDNAIKYTKTGAIVFDASLLNCSEEHCRILFSISDTGIGIADEMINYVFRPFTQASEGLSRTFGGAGVGLSICRQFVDLIGGTLAIESRIGKGTTVYVSLPFKLPYPDEKQEEEDLQKYLKPGAAEISKDFPADICI
jgi:signal transduction histidine kinase